jgi:hypothetical protein
MAINFRQANFAAPGTIPTSRQWNQFANAINDRLGSGLGDPSWRIWWRAYSLMRKPRNNQGELISANDEWFSHWAHLDPRQHPDATWGDPIGQEGGANVANPLLMYLFGLNGVTPDFFEEGGRYADLTDHLALSSDDPMTLWEKGKAQRGAIDVATHRQFAPALAAAGAYRRVLDYVSRPLLERYGGWHRVPAREPVDCDGGAPKFLFRFTPLRGGPALVFDTCSPAGLQSITYEDDYYFLRFLDGSTRTLLHRDYLEGPYAGPALLGKTPGDQLLHVLAHFAGEFRGTDAQRASDRYRVSAVAADFQKFFTRQYALAPARGEISGPDIEAIHPQLIFNAAGGTLPPGSAAVGSHLLPPGFVLAGCLITASGLTNAASVRLVDPADGSKLYETIRIEPGSPGIIRWFDAPPSSGSIGAVLVTALDADAQIVIECAELLDYKPGLMDAAMVMRAATSSGDLMPVLDGNGHDFAEARSAMSLTIDRGCITNDGGAVPDQTLAGLVQNPVHEAARELFESHLRLAKRDQLIGYTVAGGKSIFTFRRHVVVSGEALDLFAGLAPPKEEIASGKIGAGMSYIVLGGTGVNYAGVIYTPGQIFMGTYDVPTYQKVAGDEIVKQYEGIVTGAPQHEWTNEWQMFLSGSPFNLSDLPLEAYNDAFTMLFNGAHFNSGEIQPGGQNPDLFAHFQPTFGETPESRLLNPEAPTALNYTHGSTSPVNWFAGRGFFQSRRIHVPDYIVESVTSIENDTQVVVRLAGRLHHLPDVAGEVTPRTDENAVLDYLAFINGGDPLAKCPHRPGDEAGGQSSGLAGGCCVPRFYFTKKIPRAWSDFPIDTDTMDLNDTRMVAQQLRWADFALGAMCEGYLDRMPPVAGTDPQYNCQRPPNFTYESLCHRAFGNRWISFLPPAIRPDNPKGFGPSANTIIYSEIFNRLGTAVNLLTEVLVEMPLDLESREVTTFGRMELTGPIEPLKVNYTPPSRTCPPPGGEPDNFLLHSGIRLLLSLDEDHPPASSGFQPPGTTEDDFATSWSAGLGHFRALNGASGGPGGFTDADPPPLSLEHRTGIEYVVDSNSTQWHFVHCNGTDWVFLFLHATVRGECRLRQPADAPLILTDDLRALLGTSGFAHLAVFRREQWLTQDAAGEYPRCGTDSWPNPNVKVQKNAVSAVECRNFPLHAGFFDGTAPLQLYAPPVRPSLYWQSSDGQAICNDGAFNSLETTAMDYLSVSVPVTLQT